MLTGNAAETQTLYVPIQCGDPSTNDSCNATADNVVDVVSAARCGPGSISGCAVIARATVGSEPIAGTIDERTDTIYIVTALGTVSVINGATCNAADHSRCHHPAPSFSAGFEPNNIGVDDRTDTVYVPDWNDGDIPGTVTVFNAATCNGTDLSGCATPAATATVGIGPFDIEINDRTGFAYIPDLFSAEVSELDGSRCNGERARGCARATREQPVGSDPDVVAVNDRTNSVYAMDTYGPTTMAVFAGARGGAG